MAKHRFILLQIHFHTENVFELCDILETFSKVRLISVCVAVVELLQQVLKAPLRPLCLRTTYTDENNLSPPSPFGKLRNCRAFQFMFIVLLKKTEDKYMLGGRFCTMCNTRQQC